MHTLDIAEDGLPTKRDGPIDPYTNLGWVAAPDRATETRWDLDRYRDVIGGQIPGKVLVIDFWATWCVACRNVFPTLNALHKKYGTQACRVIGISIDGPRELHDVYRVDKGGIIHCAVGTVKFEVAALKENIEGLDKVLGAAAWTYVAGAVSAIGSLLYLVAIAIGSRRERY